VASQIELDDAVVAAAAFACRRAFLRGHHGQGHGALVLGVTVGWRKDQHGGNDREDDGSDETSPVGGHGCLLEDSCSLEGDCDNGL